MIIARDQTVLRLKHQLPKFSEEMRLDLVLKEDLVDDAALGDVELSVYQTLGDLNPDVICLGYDQQKLGVDLQLWMNQSGEPYPIYYLKPCKPHLLHNSLLHSDRF